MNICMKLLHTDTHIFHLVVLADEEDEEMKLIKDWSLRNELNLIFPEMIR